MPTATPEAICRIDQTWPFRWGIEGLKRRFLERVKRTHCCWLWTGQLGRGGYGQGWLNGRNVPAHRVAYILFVGEIPTGLQLDHTCGNRRCGCEWRRCVRPDHLEPVTQRENCIRSPACGIHKTHCKYGHEYTPDNTIHKASGGRWCRTCYRERDAARYYRNKDARILPRGPRALSRRRQRGSASLHPDAPTFRSIFRREHCASCGIEIDETDGMAARQLDGPPVPLCVKCLVTIHHDQLPLVHPQHQDAIPLTFVVACCLMVAAVLFIGAWLLGGCP